MNAGTAVTFFTEDDAGRLRALANVIRAAGSEVPQWMFSLEKEKKRRKKRPVETLEEDESSAGQEKKDKKRDGAGHLQKNKKKMPNQQPRLKPTARKTKSNLPRKLGSRKPISGTSKKKKKGPTKR